MTQTAPISDFVDPNTQEQQANLQKKTANTDVTDVTLVYKNHLDIGFTELVSKVTHDAIHWMLHEAINLNNRMQEQGFNFTWTTPSWVIYEALEITSGDSHDAIEKACADGVLAWHALPFTPHTELYDPYMLDGALSLTDTLNKRFNRKTRAAKLTDVPGHTRGLIYALHNHGVELLHIGVNHMSALCEVPEAFRWRDPHTGEEVTVFYGSGYGSTSQMPNDTKVLGLRMVGDNCEIPSLQDALADRAWAKSCYPNATVISGTMDDYVGDDFKARCADLPVIEAELGDSWVHGTGSDPFKSQRFRALQRLHAQWRDEGKNIPAAFVKNLSLVAEHTWGVNFNAHNYHENTHWNNRDFHPLRKRGYIRGIEASWQEQRDYLALAVAALDNETQAQATQVMVECDPAFKSLDGWQPWDPSTPLHHGLSTVSLDPERGHITSLVLDGKELCDGPLGAYVYQTFNHDDCEHFCRLYNRGRLRIEEFTKKGLQGTDAVSKLWYPTLDAAYTRQSSDGIELLARLSMPHATHDLYGAPAELELHYALPTNGKHLDAKLTWQDKTATRLPESGWWQFQPATDDQWEMHKCGAWIKPSEVIPGGGRELHGIQDGVRNGAIHIESLDAHLVAPEGPNLYNRCKGEIKCDQGLYFNLHNNCWGTNFVMWCEDDLHYRVRVNW